MRATRASMGINIDGKLDEQAWASAVPSGDFTQSYPNVGAKATDPTEVRVLYDDLALYVGVWRMFRLASRLDRPRSSRGVMQRASTPIGCT